MDELNSAVGALSKAGSDIMQAFEGFIQSVLKPGPVGVKTKDSI